MRAVLALITLLAAGLAARPAAAQVVSQRPDRVSVVLYQDHAPAYRPFAEGEEGDVFGGDPGLAVVSETRTVDLPAGRTRLSFRGVADGMVPQTAAIEGLDGRLIERNYDFDLLSPGTLVEKAIGAPARLVRTNPKTGQTTEVQVTVRSGPDGIVLQHADGSAEALGCSDLPEKLVFDQAPPGLTATPTLSAEVETATAGRHVIRLSYLATGLRWKADYVARLNPDGRTLNLHGWLTLSNRSSTSFADAPTQVVAGRLARAGDDQPVAAQPAEAIRNCWPQPFTRRFFADSAAAAPPPAAMAPMARGGLEMVVVTGSRIADVRNLGDYKLYTLPEPTTVAANQTKQVAFLEQAAVSYQRLYRFLAAPSYGADSPGDVRPLQALLRLQNKAALGLGKPLPGGGVTVFEPKPDGGLSLSGQPSIKDTPVGLPVELALGASDLVTVTATQEDMSRVRRGGRNFDRSRVTLTVRNAGMKPAPVEIRLGQSDLKILGESRPHGRDGAFAVWTLQAPAGGEATLTYRTEQAD
ncbi:MAG: DUF4139 domain-containing protein [Caulobacteraceae bacterium]